MSIPTAASAAQRSTLRLSARAALAAAAGFLVIGSGSAHAQSAPPRAPRWELRVTGGAFAPTGTQRNVLKDAQVTAAQLSWVPRPSLAITGTFGWARSRDLTSFESPKLDVFTSDLGVEARSAPVAAGRSMTFTPFVGIGAGARSYNYRSLDVDATNNLAAYGSVGGEIGVRRLGVRLEARDYVTGFKPLVGGGKSDARNDVMILVAVQFKRQRAAQD